jgi:hypothetical protein
MEDVYSLLIPFALSGAMCLIVGVLVGLISASVFKPQPKAAKKPSASLGEEVSLWREKRSGRLVVQMDGQVFSRMKELGAKQRLHLAKLADELNQWLEAPSLAQRIGSPAEQGGKPAAPSQEEPPLAGFSQQVAAEAMEEAAGLRRVAPPGGMPAAQEAPGRTNAQTWSPRLVEKPAGNEKLRPPGAIDLIARAVSPTEKKEPAPLSIAAQVDEILQRRLEESPLKDRGIRLMELPGKGMVVMVGLRQYNSVGEVEQAEIKALIQSCVAEWERQHDTL